MDFNGPASGRIYSDRRADPSWSQWCSRALAPAGRDVVDIGCGGGIYSLALAGLGARSVIGVDPSAQYLAEAAGAGRDCPQVSFRLGSALATGLPPSSADLILERALIHHLDTPERAGNAAEAARLLRPGGLLCVQDRTFEDVLESDPAYWIRATLFACFPRLLEFERRRRPSRETYARQLLEAGFAAVEQTGLREVRRSYGSFPELEAEILSRKGKSILFELDDRELRSYCEALREGGAGMPLVECDPWTVWLAVR